jgi:hypothetical protein
MSTTSNLLTRMARRAAIGADAAPDCVPEWEGRAIMLFPLVIWAIILVTQP